MATGTIPYNGVTKSGGLQQCVVFRSTNARTAFYGTVVFDGNVQGKTITISSVADSGHWFSDGASHTLDLANISVVETHYNSAILSIPATNISSVDTVMWIRIGFNFTIS